MMGMLRFLSSMKLAVLLIVGIALFSILATIFPEVDAFSSWTFRLLVIAFFVNLSLCTIKILPKFWRQLHRKPADIVVSEDAENIEVPLEELSQWICEQRYKIYREEQGDVVKLLAVKGKMGLAAPHVLHIALLVILVGCLAYTFNESGAFMAYPEQKPLLPLELRERYGEDSYVEVVSFETAFDKDGAIDNWITTFNLYLAGQLVGEQVQTMVNKPYQYKDLVIYQNSYGVQHLVEISGSPNEVENGTYALPDNNVFFLNGNHLIVANTNDGHFLHYGGDGAGQIGIYVTNGDKVNLGDDICVEYLEESAYTVLEVKTVRGLSIVFFGFLLATIASMLFWGGRYQEIQVLYRRQQGRAYVRFYSKSPMVVENMQEKWQEHWGNDKEEK